MGASVVATAGWALWRQSRYNPEDEAYVEELRYRHRNGYPLPGPRSYPDPNDGPLVP
jgi:hypothetical protein